MESPSGNSYDGFETHFQSIVLSMPMAIAYRKMRAIKNAAHHEGSALGPVARAKGTVSSSDIPMTASWTDSGAVKCRSMCMAPANLLSANP
jgi:hypothetical protein